MSKLEKYLAAEKERLAGHSAAAIPLYREALKEDPHDWKIREVLATALRDTGARRDGSRELFTAANRLIWQGSYDQATRLLNLMLRWDPMAEFDITQQVPSAFEQIRDVQERSHETDLGAGHEDTRAFLRSLVLKEGEDAKLEGERAPAPADDGTAMTFVLEEEAADPAPPTVSAGASVTSSSQATEPPVVEPELPPATPGPAASEPPPPASAPAAPGRTGARPRLDVGAILKELTPPRKGQAKSQAMKAAIVPPPAPPPAAAEAPPAITPTATRKVVTLTFDRGQPVPVNRPNFLVGSAPDCNLILRNKNVGPHHARIVEHEGLTVVKDCGSGKPTLLNGQAVAIAVVGHKDQLAFGPNGPTARIKIEFLES